MLGGAGTYWGPLIGAVLLLPLNEGLRAKLGGALPGLEGVIYGVVIMLVILLAPEGVYWRFVDRFIRRESRVLRFPRRRRPPSRRANRRRRARRCFRL